MGTRQAPAAQDHMAPHEDCGAIQAFHLDNSPVPPIAVPGISYRYLLPGEEAMLAAAMSVPAQAVLARLAPGGKTALALDAQGRIAGYGWVRSDAIRIDDIALLLPLPRGHAYIWDCLTLPVWRGRHVFPGLLRFILEVLRQEGVHEAWAGVAPGNVASMHAFARAGFRHVADVDAQDRPRLRLTPAALPEEVDLLRRLAAR
jgi:GNAT superfamily N-acetyltransferase